jgi:hypothetical protein
MRLENQCWNDPRTEIGDRAISALTSHWFLNWQANHVSFINGATCLKRPGVIPTTCAQALVTPDITPEHQPPKLASHPAVHSAIVIAVTHRPGRWFRCIIVFLPTSSLPVTQFLKSFDIRTRRIFRLLFALGNVDVSVTSPLQDLHRPKVSDSKNSLESARICSAWPFFTNL